MRAGHPAPALFENRVRVSLLLLLRAVLPALLRVCALGIANTVDGSTDFSLFLSGSASLPSQPNKAGLRGASIFFLCALRCAAPCLCVCVV